MDPSQVDAVVGGQLIDEREQGRGGLLCRGSGAHDGDDHRLVVEGVTPACVVQVRVPAAAAEEEVQRRRADISA